MGKTDIFKELTEVASSAIWHYPQHLEVLAGGVGVQSSVATRKASSSMEHLILYKGVVEGMSQKMGDSWSGADDRCCSAEKLNVLSVKRTSWSCGLETSVCM